MREIRPRLSGNRLHSFNHLNRNESRVLVIGDLHCPFDLDGYLDFCNETYKRYNCNTTVFIGDVVDNHYASYHETDPDGLGGGEELEAAITRLRPYYKVFPEAVVTIGNHDKMIMRKAQTSNIPRAWIREYKDVLKVPGWDFVVDIEIDGVRYVHGEGSKSHIKCRKDMQSTVQGHHHTDCYVQWFVGQRDKIFGMQVGCGVDRTSYALAYAKDYPKPAIGCGVVIGGHTAINVMMDL